MLNLWDNYVDSLKQREAFRDSIVNNPNTPVFLSWLMGAKPPKSSQYSSTEDIFNEMIDNDDRNNTIAEAARQPFRFVDMLGAQSNQVRGWQGQALKTYADAVGLSDDDAVTLGTIYDNALRNSGNPLASFQGKWAPIKDAPRMSRQVYSAGPTAVSDFLTAMAPNDDYLETGYKFGPRGVVSSALTIGLAPLMVLGGNLAVGASNLARGISGQPASNTPASAQAKAEYYSPVSEADREVYDRVTQASKGMDSYTRSLFLQKLYPEVRAAYNRVLQAKRAEATRQASSGTAQQSQDQEALKRRMALNGEALRKAREAERKALAAAQEKFWREYWAQQTGIN